MHATDTPITARACAHYPELRVTVARTPIGTYRVTFTDTDADAVIESRVFTSAARAEEHARMLADQA